MEEQQKDKNKTLNVGRYLCKQNRDDVCKSGTIK